MDAEQDHEIPFQVFYWFIYFCRFLIKYVWKKKRIERHEAWMKKKKNVWIKFPNVTKDQCEIHSSVKSILFFFLFFVINLENHDFITVTSDQLKEMKGIKP